MDILNSTPFQVAPIAGRLNFPNHSYTLIVKGTFDLHHGQKAVPSDDQAYPTGDEHYPDDIDMTGSLRYESDFAFFKPRADLLLAGHCHAPSKKPVQGCRVGFQVGSVSKELDVFGDRHWKRHVGFNTLTDPEFFSKKELRFENSFGGPGFEKNPVGKGVEKAKQVSGKDIRHLPCIQDPANIIGSPKDCPEPVGFGPLGRMWQDRLSKMGTYDDQWLADQWPWFPKDFDWSHFNAAQADMQVAGYLRGDESLLFKHLHPDHSIYESTLPGLNVRCFINRRSNSNGDNNSFCEVKMNLDTLWVDMDAEKLVLVWRGFTRIESEQSREIEHIYTMSEQVAAPQKTPEACHKLFLAALQAEKQMWEDPPEEADVSQTKDIPNKGEDDALEINQAEEQRAKTVKEEADKVDPQQTKKALKKQMQTASAAILGKIGIDISKLPVKEKEKFLIEQDSLFEQMIEANPKKTADMGKQKMEAEMAENFSRLGIDIKNLPALSDKAGSEQIRMIKELTGGRIETIPPEVAPQLAMFSAILTRFGIDPENMDPFIEEAKKQQELMGGIPLEKKDPEGVIPEDTIPENLPETPKRIRPLTRQIVKQETAERASFAGEDLSGLDLSGLDFSGIDFAGANFTKADLTKITLADALCPGAIFEKANLTEADLTRINIEHANMKDSVQDNICLKDAFATGADFSGVSLKGAVLTDAVFEKVTMTGAIVDGAKGLDTCFTEAVLSGTSFKKTDFSGADFSCACLNDVNFAEAILFEASIEGAECKKGNFSKADLTFLRASEETDLRESTFYMASGKESMWRGANLSHADFSYSAMQGADFSDACMEEADLTASDMKFARFIKTDLYNARLVHMNLFQGCLEKARLVHTDLSFSNMYGVEFMGAEIKNLKVENTNLKMTKLLGPRMK